jgi:hypothetical protein
MGYDSYPYCTCDVFGLGTGIWRYADCIQNQEWERDFIEVEGTTSISRNQRDFEHSYAAMAYLAGYKPWGCLFFRSFGDFIAIKISNALLINSSVQ